MSLRKVPLNLLDLRSQECNALPSKSPPVVFSFEFVVFSQQPEAEN
jgi:hypothetical protein